MHDKVTPTAPKTDEHRAQDLSPPALILHQPAEIPNAMFICRRKKKAWGPSRPPNPRHQFSARRLTTARQIRKVFVLLFLQKKKNPSLKPSHSETASD